MMNEQDIQRIREILVREFSEEELIVLCRDIGVSYDGLAGMGPYGKTRELMNVVQEEHISRTLMHRVQQLRPQAYKDAGLETVEPERALTITPPPQAGSPEAGETAAPREIGSSAPEFLSKSPTVAPGLREGDASATNHPNPVSEKEASKPMNNDSRQSILPVRIRLIGFIIVVLLLAVAALSIALQPRKGGTPVIVPPTTVVTLQPATGALTTTNPLSPEVSTVVATPQPVVVEDTPTPAGTISETHPASMAIRSINDTLVAFYGGKATTDDFKADFVAAKYQVIINFAYKTLKTKVGADLQKGDKLNVTLRYDKGPLLTAEKNGVATVVTQEYWVYINPANNKTYCDKAQYTYTLSKVGDAYQIRDLKSKPVSGKCEQ